MRLHPPPSLGDAYRNSVDPSPEMNARVIVIDDHPVFRQGIVELMQHAHPDAARHVVSTGSVEGALTLPLNCQSIELVLVDLRLPGLSGAEAVSTIRRRMPRATIVVISGSDDRREILAVLRAGARAFVSKVLAPSAICATLRRALDGTLREGEIQLGHLAESTPTPVTRSLTTRQNEVLALLGLGHSNKEIAARLGVAEITIKQHVSRILARLGTSNRTQAVLAARRAAILADDLPVS